MEKMFYFGCMNEPGHFFFSEHGSTYNREEEILPWKDFEVDGKLQPHRKGCTRQSYCGCGSMPEGQALVHHKNGWTALSFWDRSIDGRPGCNSTYFAHGEFTFEDMVNLARTHFPDRWALMKFEVKEAKID